LWARSERAGDVLPIGCFFEHFAFEQRGSVTKILQCNVRSARSVKIAVLVVAGKSYVVFG